MSSRILLSVGVGLLIFSLVFGWVSFSVPDWLQFYERNGIKNNTLGNENLIDLKKYGLWYKCVYSINSNDFICTTWNNDAPSFVRVVQVLIPFGLSLSCLALFTACTAFMCRRTFVTTVLFAALFAFISFLFTTIGVTVFATESLVYVDRLRLNNNENPRRWGMWLLLPNLILSFLTSICFILASLFNWCDYRTMQATGILSHTAEKYNDSVFKAPSDSNATPAVRKQQQQYQDYPNGCYQINGLNNNQQNPIGYPPPPTYGSGTINPMFQPTPPGLFGYSRPPSPTINQIHPYPNYDPHHSRYYMTENSELDELPRMHRSRRRSRSHSHSCHHSKTYSSRDSTIAADNNQKQTQYIPIPVPYYQPQPVSSAISQPQTTQTPIVPTNNTNSQAISYIIPQTKQQYIEENIQPTIKTPNVVKYNVGQPSVLVSNPTQPVYTIAYRANNGGNMLTSNILNGPAAATYVTASRNQILDVNSLNSDSFNEDRDYQHISRRQNCKKININETWAWRKMREHF